MVCQICRHPARETNHQLIQSLWNDGGYKGGPTLGAYDAYSYASTLRRMTGIYAAYPCGFCVPGLELVAPTQPSHYINPQRFQGPAPKEGQDGLDNLQQKNLSTPAKSPSAASNKDLAFALSQELKLGKACIREGINAVKRCYSEASGKEIAGAAAVALAATAAKGNRLTPRVVAVDTSVIAGAEISRHESCRNAATLMLGEDCMKRNLPNGDALSRSIFKKEAKK